MDMLLAYSLGWYYAEFGHWLVRSVSRPLAALAA